jgi:hypothetical protein
MRCSLRSPEVTLQLETRPLRRQEVLARTGESETILLDVDSGCFFTLDGVGARVWDLCDGSASVSEIVTAVCNEYDAPRDTVEADVLELLTELSRERLLGHG